jgi:hypothetical protein
MSALGHKRSLERQTTGICFFRSTDFPTLHASLLAKLDRLAPTREVAQIGATLGRSFSHHNYGRQRDHRGSPLMRPHGVRSGAFIRFPTDSVSPQLKGRVTTPAVERTLCYKIIASKRLADFSRRFSGGPGFRLDRVGLK